MKREYVEQVLNLIQNDVLVSVSMEHMDIRYHRTNKQWTMDVFDDGRYWVYDDTEKFTNDILKIYEHMDGECIYDEPERFEEVAKELVGELKWVSAMRRFED